MLVAPSCVLKYFRKECGLIGYLLASPFLISPALKNNLWTREVILADDTGRTMFLHSFLAS